MDRFELSVIGVEHSSLPDLLAQSGFSCQLQTMTWDTEWESLARIALYRHGPDVSQIAVVAVDDFVAMGALRPFTKEEVTALGGSSAFLPAIWQSTLIPGSKQAWAIPWLADTRVIYYWRDMLEQAGVEEETAFQTPQRVEETLAQLQASGIPAPWAVTTGERKIDRYITLQNAISWIWSAGGDLISADRKQVLLDQPEACAGLRAYFELHRYFPASLRHQGAPPVTDMFIDRQVASVMGPCGWFSAFRQIPRPDLEKIGIASPPGPAYVGGSSLVIWQHSLRAGDAVELIRFLTDRQVQTDYLYAISQIPTRLEVLEEPPYATDPHLQAIVNALRTGRAYPVFPKLGLVEEKLTEALGKLWEAILSEPEQDSGELIRSSMESLARRVAVALKTRV